MKIDMREAAVTMIGVIDGGPPGLEVPRYVPARKRRAS
jgi:hypothetical protein